MWYDNAFDVWNDLTMRYGSGDPFRFSDLLFDFYGVK